MAGTCGHCGADTGDSAYLCTTDTKRLEASLQAVAGVWDDLEITAAKQDAGARSEGSSTSCESQAPVNLDAIEHMGLLRICLYGAVARTTDQRVFKSGRTGTELVAQLVGKAHVIRRHEWAAAFLDELTRLLRAGRALTDRCADKITLGTCSTECDAELVAVNGATHAKCQVCGTVWDVHERQQWMIAQAWDVKLPLRPLVAALRKSKHLTASYEAVRKRAQRGKLVADVCEVATRIQLYSPATLLAEFPVKVANTSY